MDCQILELQYLDFLNIVIAFKVLGRSDTAVQLFAVASPELFSGSQSPAILAAAVYTEHFLDGAITASEARQEVNEIRFGMKQNKRAVA